MHINNDNNRVFRAIIHRNSSDLIRMNISTAVVNVNLWERNRHKF